MMMNMKFRSMLNYFLLGVFSVIPIVVILQIILFVKNLVAELFKLVYFYADNYFFAILVFAVSFALLTFVGYTISKNGRFWVIAGFDLIIEKIPFLNTVYRVTKKIVNLFYGREKREAREVVYVEYPKEGIWVPAYVTNKEKDMYVLFIPTSPNPTSGFTVIVHESKLIKSAMNVEEATSFIVSVGVDFNKSSEIESLPSSH